MSEFGGVLARDENRVITQDHERAVGGLEPLAREEYGPQLRRRLLRDEEHTARAIVAEHHDRSADDARVLAEPVADSTHRARRSRPRPGTTSAK